MLLRELKKKEMKNKTREKIEELKAKIIPMQVEINKLANEEVLTTQRPRLQKIIGMCLQSTSEEKTHYARILDLVEDKDGDPWFILEEISLQGGHNPYMHLNNITPYLNKEWWDSPVPIYGYKPCKEDTYLKFKETVLKEFMTQNKLRTFCKNYS